MGIQDVEIFKIAYKAFDLADKDAEGDPAKTLNMLQSAVTKDVAQGGPLSSYDSIHLLDGISQTDRNNIAQYIYKTYPDI